MSLSAIDKLFTRLFGWKRSAPDLPLGFAEWIVAGIKFDDRGLTAGTASASSMTWTDRLGAQVALMVSPQNRPSEFLDGTQARIKQRHVAAAEGRSLVSVECVTTPQGVSLVEVITKSRVGAGFDYIGSLLVEDG